MAIPRLCIAATLPFPRMVIDCHVHVAACVEGCGSMSDHLVGTVPFRFLRRQLGIGLPSPATHDRLRAQLLATLDQTPEINAAVILAFDAVHTHDGRIDPRRTHLHVTNDYVMQLAREHPKVLFGASIHPYRTDAIAELERCVAGGAVLLKWLPIAQDIDPADPRCLPFYEALAHHRLPLLSHTGWEKTLPNLNRLADPALLLPAVQRGCTVIAAHCGTRSMPWEKDYFPTWAQMAREHERFFGDTAALAFPTRHYGLTRLLEHADLRRKIIHGSDWPIPAYPLLRSVGGRKWRELMRERNWLRRDVLIKRQCGLGDDYFRRAADVLRLPQRQPASRLP
jgi:predicted TIM-barrel fold metal-dependent hydrolase